MTRSTSLRRGAVVTAMVGGLALAPVAGAFAQDGQAPSAAAASSVSQDRAAPAAKGETVVQKKGSKGKKRVHVVRRYTEFDGKYTWHVTVWSNGKVTKWKERATIVRPSPPGPVTPDEPDNAEQGSAA